MDLLSLSMLSPEIILCLGALIIILLDIALPKVKKYVFGIVAYLVTITSFLALGVITNKTDWLIFQGTYGVDGFAVFFKALLLLAGSIVLLFSITYLYKGINYKSEFYALILFSIMSMMVLVSSTDLVLTLLAFEFVSISCYILVGYCRNDIKSKEASVKYFFFGAISSAVLLMGFSFIYGITGETRLYDIIAAINGGKLLITDYKWIALLGLVFVGAGFGFKIAMVPFQMWVPDVYEGAPTPVTAFLSVGSKSAGMAIFLRFFFTLFKVQNFPVDWSIILIIISILTMFLGNLMAISQTNIKRMLGYSSIAHVGYMLAGIAGLYHYTSSTGVDVSPILIYLMAYVYMNLGAFAVIILSEDATNDYIPSYAGLSQKAPVLAGTLAVFFLSLAGLPPLAGFVGKFYVFGEVVNASYYFLAIIAVINSIISVYYYFRVVHYMYFVPAEEGSKEIKSYSILTMAGLYVCLAGTIMMGIMPNWIIEIAKKALIGIKY